MNLEVKLQMVPAQFPPTTCPHTLLGVDVRLEVDCRMQPAHPYFGDLNEFSGLWRNARASPVFGFLHGEFWAGSIPCMEMEQKRDLQQIGMKSAFLGIQLFFFFSHGSSQLGACFCRRNYSVSTLDPCFSFLFILFCFDALFH